jgi:hypothetical protein
MENFPAIICDNLPGVKKFYFVPVDDVASISDPDGFVVSVTFDGGKDWLTGMSTERMVYEELSEEDDNGDVFIASITGFVPGNEAELLEYFNELRRTKFLVKAVDGNDMERLLGSIEIPARFKYKIVNDNESNGFRFTFSAVHPDLPPFFMS